MKYVLMAVLGEMPSSWSFCVTTARNYDNLSGECQFWVADGGGGGGLVGVHSKCFPRN